MWEKRFTATMTKERLALTPPFLPEMEYTAINHRQRQSKRVVDSVAKKKTTTTILTARRRSSIVCLNAIVFGCSGGKDGNSRLAYLGMLGTCQQHIGKVSKCWKFWVNMRVGANTKITPTQNFASGITDKL
jgi:hypothetical protein